MRIPIENIYYLLCYAWNTLEEKEQVDVTVDDHSQIIDLLSRVLINGTRIILKKGLDKHYVEEVNEIAGIRGKLALGQTIKHNLLHKQRTICTYDEYSADVIHNQILVTTFYQLLNHEELDPGLKSEIRRILHLLPEIQTISLRDSTFRIPRFHRNNRFYGFLMHVCELIYQSSLPAEEPGKWRFSDFSRDERKMNRLFENFIFNFYQKEQHRYRVRREQIQWQFTASEDDKAYLPVMLTDITLENENEKIIIDAKYYQETMSSYYDTEKIKSVNLYQLFSYLLQQENGTERNANTRGILLYPTVQEEHNLHYRYGSHDIWIKTINLNQHWRQIEEKLRALIA